MRIIKLIPNSVYWFLVVILVIADAIGMGVGSLVQKIKFASISESYETLMELGLEDFFKKYIWVFLVVTAIVLVAFLLKLLYRENLYILSHFSFEKAKSGLSKKTKSEYRVKEYCLSQDTCFEIGLPKESALVEIKTKIRNMLDDAGKSEIGYYGIAHIPFIFYAGYVLGNMSKIHAFHRMRNNNALFEELSVGTNSDIRLEASEKGTTKKTDELVVAISTSFLISEEEIKRNFGTDKHIVTMQTTILGFDQLNQYDSVERITNDAWANIRKYTKKYCVKKVHLLIASSVAFTFYMGRKCSAQIDPQITVYHYQNGQYSWGVSVNNADGICHVVKCD